MFRNPIPYLLMCFLFGNLEAQITIKGTLLDDITRQPLAGINVITTMPDQATTDADGKFSIRHVQTDQILLQFTLEGTIREYTLVSNGDIEIDLGDILLNFRRKDTDDLDLPTITLEEIDDQSDVVISGLLQAGDDLFAQMTNFTFSPARFSRRGLESVYTDGYLNNLPINNLESGGIFWNNWGGLNDVMRQDADFIGAEMSDWGFGGLSNTFNTDLRASSQWKQTKLSYAVTNRNYRNRLMGTWSTGLLPSGWAISLSGSRRWAQEGYIDGTYYDAWSYFASVDKRFNAQHTLNFVAMGAPYERGASSSSVQEMYDLSDNQYYNSFWGYQQGKKRSARVFSAHQPMFSIRHDFTINEKLKLTTAVGYQTGKSTVGALDWLNANDPRPDYYRRLPSYIDDPDLAAQMTALLTSDKDLLQIQWDDLYQINLNSDFTVEDANGIEGNTINGALSRYVMEDRIADVNKLMANIVLQFQVNANSQINIGVNAVNQDTRNYKEVNDLMGGDFYLDWDKFAAQDFPGNEDALQNDLLRPNRVLYQGDQFGWDFDSKVRQQSAWVSYALNVDKWEVGFAGALKNQTFWRDGHTVVGKFPDNSYGESVKNDFLLPSVKGLIRYKIDGRNYITVSGMLSEMAPTFRNAYVSPRTRDNIVSGLEAENINLTEVRYDFKSPYIKFSLAGYYIQSKNGIESTSFYHDDLRTFVNFSLTDIDKEHAGIEAALEYKLSSQFTLQAAVAAGQYIYTSRPDATVTQDNDGSVLLEDITIYAQNLYVSGTPQTAWTTGLSYHSKKFWTLFLNVNRFEESWVNFNPIRRTTEAVELVEYQSDQWNEILAQEKLDPAWTVDISMFKTWRVNWPSDETTYSLNIGITNLLNNQDFVNNGYEQYRFDFENKDVSTFPAKYGYMQGLNYFIQGSMRF